MTARGETVRAMADSYEAQSRALSMAVLGRMLDAVPADKLARLAIERGGLVQADVWDRPLSSDRTTVYYEDEPRPDDAVPLYRLAED